MQPEDQSGVCAPSVFDATFLRVAPLLRNFLYYRTGDAENAADLVQEAFVRLWENCSKVLPDKARAWLFKVGENLFLQQVARARVAGRYALEMVRTEEAQGESPEALLEEKEFAERLDAAIAALPEGSREVFLLNRIDGLKYREIAELLGISQKAVEKRMHRALVELRELHPGV